VLFTESWHTWFPIGVSGDRSRARRPCRYRPHSDLEAQGDIAAPWAKLFATGIAIGMGRGHDERYNVHLRDLIIAGLARHGTVVTQRLPLSSAPAAFRTFDRREDGYVKVVLEP
jgi:threonine dehydrogenase-like Zn-dependent dehydrogenase